MSARLANTQYDRETQRAYVELRAPDSDGGEILAVAIFSFQTKTIFSQEELERDLVRKARYIFKNAALGLNGK